jgi:ADP-ribose pyrophosphatase YjhB (NUDIX family)
MKYCPECGYALELRDRHDRQRMCCPNCAYVQYGAFTVGVGGIVIESEQVLLVHRRRAGPTGSWLIPGGYIEQDERLDEAALREVREETGLETCVEGLVGVRSRLLEREHSLYIVVLMRPIGGSLRPDGIEVDDVRYFSIADLEVAPDITPFSRSIALRAIHGGLPVIQEATMESVLPGRWIYYG